MSKENPRRIVAEACRNWGYRDDLDKPLLCQTFEQVIHNNEQRGYALESWQLTSKFSTSEEGKPIMVETIIAVFVLEQRKTDASYVAALEALLDEADEEDLFGTEGWRRKLEGTPYAGR